MSSQVFISHSSQDAELAQEICLALETAGLNCWIAPRDIHPGASYAASIVAALDHTETQLLVLTEASNSSPQVVREVERAASRGLPIIVVRLDSVEVRPEFEYFTSLNQWINARREFGSWISETVQAIEAATRPQMSPPTIRHPHGIEEALSRYRRNLEHEMRDNLVLELYDQSDYRRLCIEPTLVPAEHSTRKPASLHSILKRSERIAIVGEPGSGKTTALRLSCLELLAEEPRSRIPLYTSAASFSHQGLSTSDDAVEALIDLEFESLDGPTVADIDAAGLGVTLLLDGWDELPDHRLREQLRRNLLACRHNFIIASRQEHERSLPPVERYNLTKLSSQQIEDFLTARFPQRRQVERLLGWLNDNTELGTLATNPLNLSLIGIAFQQSPRTQDLTRTEVHERALEAIIRKNYHPDSSSSQVKSLHEQGITFHEIDVLFQRLAYKVTSDSRGRFFSISLVESLALDMFGERAASLTASLLGRFGILRDRRGGKIEFFHLWYQEFFTARRIATNSPDLKTLASHYQIPQMHASLPFTVGILDSDLAFSLLISLPPIDPFIFCRAIPEGRFGHDKMITLVSHSIEQGFSRVPRVPVRIEMAPALASIGSRAIGVLREILYDAQRGDYARRAALEALSRLTPPQEFGAMLLEVLDDSDLGLLWHVIEHVGRARVPSALPMLRRYTEHADPIVVGDSLWAISRIEESDAVVPEESLQNVINCLYGQDPHRQGHALRTLGRIGDQSCIPALATHLRERSSAYRWIVPEAAATIGGAQAVELLGTALTDESYQVIAAALEGIARCAGEISSAHRDSLIDAVADLLDSDEWIGASRATLGEIAHHAMSRLKANWGREPSVE